MPLSSIIPKMNFASIRDAVAVLLANELAEQKSLFLVGGGTEQEFENDYSFTVGAGLYYPEDEGVLPLVNVYAAKVPMIPARDDYESSTMDTQIYIDLFTLRSDAVQDSGAIIDGSTGADKRMDYLISQVYFMLEAQINNFWGQQSAINSFEFQSWEKDTEGIMRNVMSVPVVMTRMIYSVKTTDQKPVNNGFDSEGFGITVELNEKAAGSIIIN